MVAGGLAGAIEACISYPTEFVKTKLQLFDMGKQGPIQVAKETIKNDGRYPGRRAPVPQIAGLANTTPRFSSLHTPTDWTSSI